MTRFQRMRRRSQVIRWGWAASVLVLTGLLACAVAIARTKSFPDPTVGGRNIMPDFMDRYAMLTEDGPRTSHAGHETGASTGIWGSSLAMINDSHSVLFRYDISSIPKGMRITNAELVMPVYTYSPADTRFFIYRMVTDWGDGASWKYRYYTPDKKLEWAMPGAKGGSSDRATGATASLRVKAGGAVTLNVTADVEMWYTKAAPNNGWQITVEEPNCYVGFYNHFYSGYAPWVLRVTYEPE